VRDENGTIYTSPRGIATTFSTFLKKKYTNIAVDPECISTLSNIIPKLVSREMANDLETPFTIPEIHHAITSGGQNRAPGRDGISLEFYKRTWDFIKDDLCTILNTMFFGNTTTTQQKAGIIVCLPKPTPMLTPADRRPITPLNSDIKIVTRILVQRLWPKVEAHQQTTQYCEVPGNNILDAVTSVRDIIAYAENNDIPTCVLTLDFQNAFDNVSHDYLFSILRSYGLSAHLIALIKSLYTDVTSAVIINGDLHGPIPIRCGVRQGCPLSMTLYNLCL
jgi:hypothetical protein